MDDLDKELYKSLRAECAAYHDKLQSLWLQKLTLSAAVVAFVVARGADLARLRLDDPVLLGFALVAALMLTIDLKVLEYGFHVRAVSRFILRTFDEAPRAAAWEGVLWGSVLAPERPLVLARTGLTIVSAALPTLTLLGAGSALLLRSGSTRAAGLAGLGLIAGYLVVLAMSGRSLLATARAGRDGCTGP